LPIDQDKTLTDGGSNYRVPDRSKYRYQVMVARLRIHRSSPPPAQPSKSILPIRPRIRGAGNSLSVLLSRSLSMSMSVHLLMIHAAGRERIHTPSRQRGLLRRRILRLIRLWK